MSRISKTSVESIEVTSLTDGGAEFTLHHKGVLVFFGVNHLSIAQNLNEALISAYRPSLPDLKI